MHFANRELIVIGASAGGVAPLRQLILGLSPELPACVCAVVHTSTRGGRNLTDVLGHTSPLPVRWAREGEAVRPGAIFVAPPDYHLLLDNGSMRLARGPTEHFTRPAVDPLFRTAAAAYGPRVIGVILSGSGSDGALGLAAVKRRGGVTVVQDPAEAEYRDMPEYAARHVAVEHVLPAREIPGALNRLASERVVFAGCEAADAGDAVEMAAEAAIEDQQAQIRGENGGQTSVFTCPECCGTLWQMDGAMIQFRCHAGHLYSGEELLEGQAGATESGAWQLLRYLRDQGVLASQLARKAELDGRMQSARRYERRAREAAEHLSTLRRLIESLRQGELEERMETAD